MAKTVKSEMGVSCTMTFIPCQSAGFAKIRHDVSPPVAFVVMRSVLAGPRTKRLSVADFRLTEVL
ncbi:hypothetical protein [uncultured Boseongicola sp.]|uniref:hypothetical protein n=1 Tax=uncultured Boseongicola sp. TaxID=1648499 RepID=UPI002635ABB9|nr:hypothetical protein [uncultured Boseongicola sp.]